MNRVIYKEYVVDGVYAQTKDNKKFYPVDQDVREYIPTGMQPIEVNGIIVHPSFRVGPSAYLLDEKGRQLYQKVNDRWLFHKFSDIQIYARDEKGNEYYPEDNSAAKDRDGSFYYARDAKGEIVFPKDKNGNEFYLGPVHPRKAGTIPSRYVKDSLGNEIYPKRVHYGGDYMIDDEYAVGRDGQPYYPKDGRLNEYYRKKQPVLLKRYAVTNDGRILLPMDSNERLESPKLKRLYIATLDRREKEIPGTYVTETFMESCDTPRTYYTYQDGLGRQIDVHPVVYPPSVIIRHHTHLHTKEKWWCWLSVFILIVSKMILIGWYLFYRKSPVTSEIMR